MISDEQWNAIEACIKSILDLAKQVELVCPDNLSYEISMGSYPPSVDIVVWVSKYNENRVESKYGKIIYPSHPSPAERSAMAKLAADIAEPVLTEDTQCVREKYLGGLAVYQIRPKSYAQYAEKVTSGDTH